MLIGELSKRTGLTKDTIRFYEKQGLIMVEPNNGGFNNYKNYTEDIYKRLTIIKRIKGFGFTLKETADLLNLIELNQASCKTVSKQVEEKISALDQKILELQQIKRMMGELTTGCCQPNGDMNCPSLTNVA
jgi:DNA-binding transcriptional MerR regulator